ncbi:MAG: fumarylacetoacetate hydrolase family protein [Rhodospirillales bacterium]
MKLVRYGKDGAEKPGILDAAGNIRDLSGTLDDITPDVLSPESLDQLRAINPDILPVVEGKPRLGCPLTGIRKIPCIGRNYAEHAAEMGTELPKEPTLFIKATSAISGPYDPLVAPKGHTELDWEVELACVMGTDAHYISEEDAPKYVAGYVLMNDVSERVFQRKRGGNTTKGKSCDTFGPIGPWLVTADEVADPQNLHLWTDVNGTRYQDGNTKDMIFSMMYIVSYLSQFMTLQAGDVVSTGSPHGSGGGLNPPVYLKEGDIIELGIGGLGSQRHEVIAWDAV